MRLSRSQELASVKHAAAKVLTDVAAAHDTLQERFQTLQQSWTVLEARGRQQEATERQLRRRIADLERPWYVRLFQIGESV